MTGRVKTADQLKEATILRAGGYSLAAIANKTGISASTLQRHFRKFNTPKGSLSSEAIEEARQALLNDAGFVDGLKCQIAASIADDLAHVAQLREAMALTLEGLMADSTLPAHYKTRGLAALATSLRLTQEAGRKALAIDNLPPEQDSIPVLTIAELTGEEIESIHRQQREAMGYNAILADEEPNSIIEEVG
jgi:AcrR family transcriptional regulator